MHRTKTIATILLLIFATTLMPHTQAALTKKAVFIIAPKDFRDEEYSIPRKLLEKQGFKVTVASLSLEPAKGMLGMVVKPDIKLADIAVEKYDALVFVGGSGAKVYWDNSTAHKIAKEAVKAKKVLGAICIAPVILAKAGVLKGKEATVWSSSAKDIEKCGAIYAGEGVIVTGDIITASGPKQAHEFGMAIIKALAKKK